MKLPLTETKTGSGVGCAIRSLVSDVLDLRRLSDIQEETCVEFGVEVQRPEERGDQDREIYLGVVSVSLIVKGIMMSDITKLKEKRKGLRTQLGEEPST